MNRTYLFYTHSNHNVSQSKYNKISKKVYYKKFMYSKMYIKSM